MCFVLRRKQLAAASDSLPIITGANASLNNYAKGHDSELATN